MVTTRVTDTSHLIERPHSGDEGQGGLQGAQGAASTAVPASLSLSPAAAAMSGGAIGSGAAVLQMPAFMAPLRPSGQLGTREEIQAELDGIAFAARSFHLKQPDAVMKECAAYSARLTELAVLLHRVESLDRQYTRVRTQQVERWMAELANQFKIASRLVEVSRQDLELMKG